jgi:outer membrane receptor for ferrienterochelin and colicin
VLGGRYTDHELSGTQLSPRLGAIYSYDDKQTFKALYSTGYNSPNPLQTNINLPGNVVGDPKLKAEIVSSLDLVYSYSESHLLFVANIYKMKAKDFIIRRYSDPLASVSFFNEGFYSREGAELDFQIVYDDLKIFANMAYVKQGNSVINHDPDAFRVAKHTFSSGLSYNITEQHSVGTNISFIGKRAGLGSYAVYGFNYTASFTHFDVVANIYNAFGKKVRNPNNSSQNSSLVALDEVKANYELGLRFSF